MRMDLHQHLSIRFEDREPWALGKGHPPELKDFSLGRRAGTHTLHSEFQWFSTSSWVEAAQLLLSKHLPLARWSLGIQNYFHLKTSGGYKTSPDKHPQSYNQIKRGRQGVLPYQRCLLSFRAWGAWKKACSQQVVLVLPQGGGLPQCFLRSQALEVPLHLSDARWSSGGGEQG